MSDDAIHREELRLARQLARAAYAVSISARPDGRSHGTNMIVGATAIKELQEALDELGTSTGRHCRMRRRRSSRSRRRPGIAGWSFGLRLLRTAPHGLLELFA